MSFTIKDDEEKYKPSIKFKYRLFDKTKLSLRYRKEISDRDDKPTKRVDRIEGKISQKIGKLDLGYTLTWYHGNENLYNKKRYNTEHEVEVGYQLTQHFSPYIGVKNEAVSKSSSERQTEYIIGMNYKF
jgi:predicted porin